MNRRGFIGAIGAALAGSMLDPERLLWVPGAKTISIPKPNVEYAAYKSAGALLDSFGDRWPKEWIMMANETDQKFLDYINETCFSRASFSWASKPGELFHVSEVQDPSRWS